MVEGWEGNEPYITRNLDVAEIQDKFWLDSFIHMWRTVLGSSSNGLDHACEGESVGEGNGL